MTNNQQNLKEAGLERFKGTVRVGKYKLIETKVGQNPHGANMCQYSGRWKDAEKQDKDRVS